MLDTCEELARFETGGSRLPRVEATMRVMQRIVESVPGVRVVFAGRRPLASGGRGWALAEPDPALAVRDFLALHVIRGFTEAEADVFLTEVKKQVLEDDMREAILEASEERDMPVALAGVADEDSGRRMNPFDLARYADWIQREDPDVSEVAAKRDEDPYVDGRIVGRVSDAVRRLLPAVALLHRFDASLLRPVFPGGDAEFDDAYDQLRAHEWVKSVRAEGAGERLFLDPNLRPRVRHYFERRGSLDAARERLAPGLERHVRAHQSATCPWSSLRTRWTCSRRPTRPACGCGSSRGVATEGLWDWAGQVAGRLLGEGGAVASPENPLRAAVLATLASSLLHAGGSPNLTEHWQQVAATADRHPDPVVGEWLAARALAGAVVGGEVRAVERFVERLGERPDQLSLFMGEQFAAAQVAAVEALVEAGGEQLGEGLLPWAQALDASPPLRAFALALAGAASGSDRVPATFTVSERLLVGIHHVQQGWLDWVAPEPIRDRIRLERLAVGTASSDELATWSAEAVERMPSIDGERLLSRILEVRLSRSVIDAADIEHAEYVDRYDPARQPTHKVHRSVPPLVVSVAMAWLARGDMVKCLGVLNDRQKAAEAARDEATVRAVELASLCAIRRMRMIDPGLQLAMRASRSDDPELVDAGLAALVTLGNLGPVEPYRLPPRFALIVHGTRAPTSPPGTLEYAEWLRIVGAPSAPIDLPSGDPEALVRFRLRAMALGADPELPGGPVSLGVRRWAELALEEGELLAVRLPREAFGLLAESAQGFERTGDAVGRLLAEISATLAAARAGILEGRAARMARLRECYEAVVDQLGSGPRFGDLIDATRPATEVPDVPPGWDGWIVRLYVALAACASEGPVTGAVAAVLGQHTPAELTLGAPVPAPVTAAPPRRRRALFALAALAEVAVLVAGVLTFDQGWIGWALLAVAGVAAVAVYVAVVGSTFRRSSAATFSVSSEFALTVVEQEPVVATSESVWPEGGRLTVELRQRLSRLAIRGWSAWTILSVVQLYAALGRRERPKLFELEPQKAERGDMVPPERDEYARAAAAFPEPVADALRTLLGRFDGASVALPLDIPVRVSALPWEALVSHVAAVPVRAYRRRPELREVQDPDSAARETVYFESAPQWRRFLTDAWDGWRPSTSNAIFSAFPAGVFAAAHLVGRAEMGSGGRVRFVTHSSAFDVDEFRSETRLLVVLQLEPYVTEARLDSDREQAARLRAVASEVSDRGATAVLAIPSLPPDLALMVAQRVAKSQRHRGSRLLALSDSAYAWADAGDPRYHAATGRLLGAVTEIRELIADWPDGRDLDGGAKEAYAELSLDVCLFLRHNLSALA